jgi:DNA-binding NtrC family response regulator
MLLSWLLKEFSMNKMGPKSVKPAAVAQGKILYGENDEQVLKSQSKAFQHAGYTVETAVGRKAIEQALRQGHFDVVVLGHTLNKDDRHHLPYMAKKSDSETQVLVLHASGKHPAVDRAIDSRDGDEAVLKVLSLLAESKYLAVAV